MKKVTEKKVAGTPNVAVIGAQDIEAFSERQDISSQTFALWIKSLWQNWRQGTVGVKDRSEVNLTGKKPWKQKGTGRARAGTPRSPLWRKGGVIHGPQPRVRTLKIAKKQKTNVLNALLWHFVDKAAVYVLPSSIEQAQPKTALAYNLLRTANLHDKKITLFLNPLDILHYASFINLPNVRVVYFDQVNAVDLATPHCWVILGKDLETFKNTVAQWN